jgi:6,7-dimethyl-8-ribityllumazine synthase
MRVPRRVAASFSPRQFEGTLDAAGLRFGVVCSRWNPTVTDALLAATLETLQRRGARAEDVFVARVPGAFELASGARALADSGKPKPQALIALAAIVRGETTHHEVLGHAVATALATLSIDLGVPIGFGVLTCDTMAQARARADKGVEAAEAAIEMANLRRQLRGSAVSRPPKASPRQKATPSEARRSLGSPRRPTSKPRNSGLTPRSRRGAPFRRPGA